VVDRGHGVTRDVAQHRIVGALHFCTTKRMISLDIVEVP
jgi:hypothetical protein